MNLDDQVLALAVDTIAPLAPLLLPQGAWTRNPVVKLQTSAGDVTVELQPNAAPLTTANWLHYVTTGFYDGVLFHSVVANVWVQTGTYNTTGVAQAATAMPIALESNNSLLHQTGALAMVHNSSGPDTATSGFFIDLANNTGFNYVSSTSPGYAVFGQVKSGLSVLSAISQASTATGSYASIQQATETVTGVVQSLTGVIQVAQLEAQASWQYSLDSGAHWLAGQGSSLTLAPGRYSAGSIEIQQFDAAGNASPVTPLDSAVNVGLATHWHNHVVMSQVQLTDQPDLHTLQASKTAPVGKTDAGISLTDVLAALKVYLHKPLPTEYSSPYNVVAADFDGNGTVNLSDVLNLLKYYLGKPTGDVAPQWTFVQEGVTQTHGAALSTTNALPDPVAEPAVGDAPIQLIGILRGDVDGSGSAHA
jgi:cyclophilin family peptidyl-prolyl cis-trans isomerase